MKGAFDMKKQYTKPEVEVVEFTSEILATSPEYDDGSGQNVEYCAGQTLGGLKFAG